MLLEDTQALIRRSVEIQQSSLRVQQHMLSQLRELNEAQPADAAEETVPGPVP